MFLETAMHVWCLDLVNLLQVTQSLDLTGTGLDHGYFYYHVFDQMNYFKQTMLL